jgi:hypothetical protein
MFQLAQLGCNVHAPRSTVDCSTHRCGCSGEVPSAVDLEEAPSAVEEDTMNRIARVALVAACLASAAGASAPATAVSAQFSALGLTVPSDRGHHTVIVGGEPGQAGRTWGYWGTFRAWRPGSYRATCSWLAGQTWGAGGSDSRFLCTLVVTFCAGPGGVGTPNGGTLIAQGLVRKPEVHHNLFERASHRRLALTGGTGMFRGARGSVNLSSPGTIGIAFDTPLELPAVGVVACAARSG